jgi:hypothetical protein
MFSHKQGFIHIKYDVIIVHMIWNNNPIILEV